LGLSSSSKARQGSSRLLSSSSSSRSGGAVDQATILQQHASGQVCGMLAQLLGRWELAATQALHIQMGLRQTAAAVKYQTRCRARPQQQQQQNAAWMQPLQLVLWVVQQIWVQGQPLILQLHCCTCLLAQAHRSSSRQQVHWCSSNLPAGWCRRRHRSYRSCRVCLGCHKTSQLQV
jgi:hypothetical protein